MRGNLFIVSAAAVMLSAGAARATIIVDGTELPLYAPVTNQLGMSHGATFNSNAGFATFYEEYPGIYGISGTESWACPTAGCGWYSSPWEIEFVDMADGVTPTVVNGTISAIFGDNGGDTDGIRFRIYDLGNNLIGTQTALAVTFGNISITGTGIHRLVVDQSGLGDPNSDTFVDWLSYPDPVSTPEPGTAFFLGVGAIALGGRARRVSVRTRH